MIKIKCEFCDKEFDIDIEPWLESYIKRYENGYCDEESRFMYFPILKEKLQSKNDFELITRGWCFDCWHDSWAEGYGYCPIHQFPKNK